MTLELVAYVAAAVPSVGKIRLKRYGTITGRQGVFRAAKSCQRLALVAMRLGKAGIDLDRTVEILARLIEAP